MTLDRRLNDLKTDLLNPSGPNISTNRNYPFALFQYPPHEEFHMREKLSDMIEELRMKGWNILNVDLFDTLIRFLEKQESGELIEALIDEELLQYNSHSREYNYPLNALNNSLDGYFKNQDAYPEAVLEKIREKTQQGNDQKSVVFLSRIGALYPFYRTSALLRYLDTGIRIPTIVLYPGERQEKYYLSFMGEMSADRDYRPRIY
jgi:BREX protein BrxB